MKRASPDCSISSVSSQSFFLSLSTLFILSLPAPRYVALVLPIALTVTLLTPSPLFNRLDRQAGADE